MEAIRRYEARIKRAALILAGITPEVVEN